MNITLRRMLIKERDRCLKIAEGITLLLEANTTTDSEQPSATPRRKSNPRRKATPRTAVNGATSETGAKKLYGPVAEIVLAVLHEKGAAFRPADLQVELNKLAPKAHREAARQSAIALARLGLVDVTTNEVGQKTHFQISAEGRKHWQALHEKSGSATNGHAAAAISRAAQLVLPRGEGRSSYLVLDSLYKADHSLSVNDMHAALGKDHQVDRTIEATRQAAKKLQQKRLVDPVRDSFGRVTHYKINARGRKHWLTVFGELSAANGAATA